MGTMPDKQQDLIAFFQAHAIVWSADPTAIGLSLEQSGAVVGATAAASGAYDAAIAARDASKAATVTLNAALDDLRAVGGPAINAIRAFAEASDDPASVYAAAQIPPKADPTPAPPPATPTDMSASILGDGTIRLRWKAPQPAPGAEVFTEIRRRFGSNGPFQVIGDTGAKTFVDATVPAGTHSVQYVFVAKRGEQQSDPSAPISLLLGVPGNSEEGAGEGGLSLAA